MSGWMDIEVKVKGLNKVHETLLRIEVLLQEFVEQQTEGMAKMADTLDAERANLQELNVDVDTALTEIVNLRTAMTDAMASAGVDQAARDEINATIDGMQQRIFNALNPAVPVDPGAVEPVDPGFFPPGIGTGEEPSA